MNAEVVLAVAVSVDRLVVGVFTGATYGLLAVGLVLVYRSSRFVNFAQGAIGIFGASVLGLLVTSYGVPYWLAFPLACAAGALVAVATEVVVVRRLTGRPSLVGMIATLGLADLVVVLALLMNPAAASGFRFPVPPGLPEFVIGRTPVGPTHVAMLLLTPGLLIGLTLFLRRTRQGLAMRAAADAPRTSTLDGVRPARMTTLAWAIAGGIGAMSAVLVTPTQGVQSIESLGPELLLRGLAGAVVARLHSLPLAFVASLGVGVLEQVLLAQGGDRGTVDVALAGLVLVALLVQPRLSRRAHASGDGWKRLRPRPLPASARAHWAVRALGRVAGGGLVVAVIAAAWLVTNETASVLTLVAGVSLVAMSVALLAGIAGQLSLGQFAIAGIGAAISLRVAAATGEFVLAVLAGCIAAAAAAVIVGLPAVRLRGLGLAVTTLAFALAASSWLLRRGFLLGDGQPAARPTWQGYVLLTARDYLLLALLLLLLGAWAMHNLRRTDFGNVLVALRDNEEAARALGVPAALRRIQVFALAGATAGLGGIVIAHGQAQVTVNSFPASASIDAVAVAVVGGIGFVTGPILGALLLIGVPSLFDLGIVGRGLVSLGWLLAVVLLPRGLGGVLLHVRDAVARRVTRGGTGTPESAVHEGPVSPPDPATATAAIREHLPFSAAAVEETGPLLEISDVRRSFGGVTALSGVSLRVEPHEIVGVIGPNGAGKTTLFEVVAGFTRPDAGRVTFAGEDITALPPERRAHRGLVRSFQDAQLFRTLTVHEAVTVAAGRYVRPAATAALLGARAGDHRRHRLVDDVIDAMGLGPLADREVGTLSTGTRRVVELAALITLSPRLLLLDEPSAGLSAIESNQLLALLQRVHADLGTTLLLIEHDLALLSRLATRLVAMDQGQVIAQGHPDAVRQHPDVLRSYLGDIVADDSAPTSPANGRVQLAATPNRESSS